MRETSRASASATPGARVAFEDEKGRVFFETFDDAEGARAVPFSATLVPWSDEARATYERRVSKKRGAAPRVDDGARRYVRGERNRHVTHAVLRRRIHEPRRLPRRARRRAPCRAERPRRRAGG